MENKHVYLPCIDLCTTIDTYKIDDDCVIISMLSDKVRQRGLLKRIAHAWKVLLGKEIAYAEVVTSKTRMKAYIQECGTMLEE